MLKFRSGDAGVEFSAVRNGNITRLLRNDDSHSIGSLCDTQGRTVAQTERAGHVTVVAYRKNTSCSLELVVRQNKSAIVEGLILEENILNQTCIDIGINHVAGGRIYIEGY